MNLKPKLDKKEVSPRYFKFLVINYNNDYSRYFSFSLIITVSLLVNIVPGEILCS